MAKQLLPAKYKHALDLVSDLFRDKKRDITGLPYVVHLVGVCHITEQITEDGDVHLAALLHDVLEDIPSSVYSAQQLETDFGPKVRKIVETVSHDEAIHGKDEARRHYLEQIRSGSLEACLVSGADLLHNLLDLLENYERFPEETQKQMGSERAKRRDWFWRERFTILSERLGADHPLVAALRPNMDRMRAVHSKII